MRWGRGGRGGGRRRRGRGSSSRGGSGGGGGGGGDGRGSGECGTAYPYRRRVRAKEVLEDRKVRHGRVYHLRELVVGKFGRDDVPTPELVLAQSSTLVHFLLNVSHGPVHGERHPVARDDGVVDDVRVGEFLVHHVQRFDGLVDKSSLSSYQVELS